jgi:hypothetical protein
VLPHHVWTAATPYEGDPTVEADVAMRQVWVHGSWMKALETNVLMEALAIQDILLGSTVDFNPRQANVNDQQSYNPERMLTPTIRDSFHASNGVGEDSWFFHSPLFYWNCSMAAIASDKHILDTINERSHRTTPANVTLRHSTVFAGKQFSNHKLIAADALVITLLHKLRSPVGLEWERRAESIARSGSKKWQLYPPDGRPHRSSLYEFRFQPVTFKDDLVLAIAYILMMLYVVVSLGRMRAVKSKTGLVITILIKVS